MTLMQRFQHFLTGRGSKAEAKQRLFRVLVDDRLGLTGEKKAALKKDILAVIKKYVDIDPDGFTIEFVPPPHSEIQMSAPVQLNGRPSASSTK